MDDKYERLTHGPGRAAPQISNAGSSNQKFGKLICVIVLAG
jgi:hypothetical protein